MALRILAISNHAAMLGGGEHSFLGIVSRLPSGYEVFAVTPADGELSERLKAQGVTTGILPLPAIRLHHIAHMVRSVARCMAICRRIGAGVIYANGSRACFYGGIAGRLMRIPVIWHCRIALPDSRLDFLLERLSDVIIANSRATARRFPSPGNRVHVIYNGIDIASMALGKDTRLPGICETWTLLLCVARVSRWKRHDRVLDAFEVLAGSDTRLHLVFLGDRDAEDAAWWDSLQKRTRQSAFAGRIHWVGNVADPRPWYHRANVFVLASENEPFGRVLVEAMACGVPVVAVRGGGVQEVIRDGLDGLLVAPDDTTALASLIRKLLDDKGLYTTIVESARSRAATFSLDAHVKNMSALFDEVHKRC